MSDTLPDPAGPGSRPESRQNGIPQFIKNSQTSAVSTPPESGQNIPKIHHPIPRPHPDPLAHPTTLEAYRALSRSNLGSPSPSGAPSSSSDTSSSTFPPNSELAPERHASAPADSVVPSPFGPISPAVVSVSSSPSTSSVQSAPPAPPARSRLPSLPQINGVPVLPPIGDTSSFMSPVFPTAATHRIGEPYNKPPVVPEDPPPPVKRKVGRPPGSGKKRKLLGSSAQSKKKPFTGTLPSLYSSPVLPDGTIVPKKRGPGRPRKVDQERERERERLILSGRNPNDFIEPPLSNDPVYTGLPLEALPTAKIRKESQWPARFSRKSLRGSNSTSREGSTGIDEALVEEENKKKLKTSLTEILAMESSERTQLRWNAKKSEDYLQNTQNTPISVKSLDSLKHDDVRLSKKVKVISPRKSSTTNLAPSLTSKHSASYASDSDLPRDNEEWCSACGGSGIFICCESCPKSFHFTCCSPPLEEVPEDEWYCCECQALRNPTVMVKWNNYGIFSELLNLSESRNPKEFSLPEDLRDKTFIGVETGEGGEYNDDSFKPDPPAKAQDAQIDGFNNDPSLEVDNLYDSDGKPYLCHKCGESGLNRSALSHCDYCPLVWHIDCLQEPVFGPKNIGSKWRCPNHIEDLLPKITRDAFVSKEGGSTSSAEKATELSQQELENLERYKFRSLTGATVVEPSLRSHFLKVAALSNIHIKYDDQPNLKRNTKLQDYLKYEHEDFAKKRSEYSDDTTKLIKKYKPYLEDDSEQHDEFVVPEFFQATTTKTGVSANATPELSKILCLTSSRDAGTSFIYRVPEKSVILDFIGKSRSTKSSVLDTIKEYDSRSRIEKNDSERDLVNGLIELKSQPPQNYFSQLVQVALDAQKEVKKESVPVETVIEDSELEELRHIKKLIELKGKDELIKFLSSQK